MNPVTILFVGRTGAGKTSFLNILHELEPTYVVGRSDTKEIYSKTKENIILYDTPGLGDTGNKEKEAKTDSEILFEISKIGKINVVLFFMHINDKIDHLFAYRITEISHLYDVPFTHFSIVVTAIDTIPLNRRKQAEIDIKKTIYEKFGMINVLFTGYYNLENNPNDAKYKEDLELNLKDFFNLIRDMPSIVPIINYVSTETIENAKYTFLQESFKQNDNIGKFIRKQELGKRIDDHENNRKGFAGFFRKIGDAFSGDNIDKLKEEYNEIGLIEIPEKLEKKMKKYQEAYNTLDKELLKRRSKVRFILSQNNDTDVLKSHYDHLNHSMAVL